MTVERVAVYFDGFNMYHAIDDMGINRLKWLNLMKLSKRLTRTKSQTVVRVCYFSAFAKYFQNTDKEQRLRRHEAYVRALEAKGVECIMGNFAKRDLTYRAKGFRAKWQRREEKQTDVAIGVHTLRDAMNDVFDRALIVSADTDMIPLFKVAKSECPTKTFVTVAPPERNHHRELLRAADEHLVIKRSQIEASLFGRQIVRDGKVVASRPKVYAN